MIIISLDPLKSIGVQSVYKLDGKEYCSDVVTYEFPSSSVFSVAGKDVVSESYWSLDGHRLEAPAILCIRKTILSDGSVSVSKLMKK